MSEYQYYEFQAIDRPLDRTARDALRSMSSRARITATSFINHYEWGDLKGDLQALAAEKGELDEFNRRLASIGAAHERKTKFIERLSRIGHDKDGGTA